MTVCPTCNGRQRGTAFVDGRDGDVREFACSTCRGSGEITDDHSRRIAMGRARRDERVRNMIGLREAAVAMGISPTELSKIERGDG